MHFFRRLFERAPIRGGVGFGRGVVSLAPASAQVTPQNVIIEGSTHTDAATIRSYFTGTDQASVNRAVADLSATGMFSKVSAKIVGGQVIVTVVESSQIINRVAFEGNNKLKSDQLAVEVQSKGHTGFDAAKADADVERIKDAYKKIGRSATTVSYRLVQLPNGRVDLVFKVDEGDKTGVREIKFVGNQAVSNYRLHSLMQTTEMNFLSWFKTSDVYDPDRLAQDEEAIRKYYMKNGYADFRITNTDVAYHGDPDAGYVITITVDEGAQYHVSGVTVTSHLAQGRQRFACSRSSRCTPATSTTPPRSTRRSTRSPASWRGRATPSPTCGRTASATRRPTRSRSPSPSTTARRSTSSASTSSATPAPATT